MITDEGAYRGARAQHAATQDGAGEAHGRTARETGSRRASQSGHREAGNGENFLDTVFNAARLAGCELLFEIPCALFDDPQGRAAAMRYGTRGDTELFFILFNARNGAIRILEEVEVPATVLDFTRSYAGVLGLIASDRRLTAPLLQ